ncbi:hypothetical protein LTR36_007219 [Oleoguttula mirabilis]|uniref:serine--tRNA ligase n=1 Tax=Oleoguttula mirabilis TaxID=1507867 RepID=A0AAV9JAI6_9PEZI|nr:hypothetical protein LTR36_007219 [Oleoguttula mirabilis]
MKPPFVCASCRQALRSVTVTVRDVSVQRSYTRPSFAPKPTLNLKHIRQNPGLYEQNCVDRNYAPYARNGWRILELHEKLVARQREVVELRQRNNVIGGELKSGAAGKTSLVEEAKALKGRLAEYEREEKEVQAEMEQLALELPNLSSLQTPTGDKAEVLGHINGGTPPSTHAGKSHVDIGRELDILDFEASATTSGWGWYFLKNEAALLEQALIQYALSVAMKRGWQVMTPPSLVYSHIASACGFMPRDQHGETQIYNIGGGQQEGAAGAEKASLVLAGTAEIPFAGSQANKTLPQSALPLKVIGPSRCYRAEAGARGVDTKGLYRVHEFTKVEMFAWAAPPTPDTGGFGTSCSSDEAQQQTPAERLFADMLALQTEILTALGLHARILEMPTTDLGASATRKVDMEVFFPSRTAIDSGYGEVTSASICTDYQARRLNTRVRFERGEVKTAFAHTVNGTAMAVPRILAAILENGWVEEVGAVRVPEVLRRWMPGESGWIGPRSTRMGGG